MPFESAHKEKVLVTGGAGGVGAYLSRRFASEGYQVRVFDLPCAASKKISRSGDSNIQVFCGNLMDPKSVRDAVSGMDHVMHLAAVLPPVSEANPELARAVNIQGTKNIIEAIEAESARRGKPITLRYTSSVTVYGLTQHLPPPIPLDQPLNPNDVYSETKALAEEAVRGCSTPWTIFRFAAAVYLTIRKGMFKQMRIIPPENRIEFIHIHDIADAFINSMSSDKIYGRTFILGGGPRCRMVYKDQIKTMFNLLGFPEPNWGKFSNEPFNLDWYDTSESQEILKFQNRTFEDYLSDFRSSMGWKFPALRWVAGPLLRLIRLHL